MGLRKEDLTILAVTVGAGFAGAYVSTPAVEALDNYLHSGYYEDLKETGGMQGLLDSKGDLIITLRESGREYEQRTGKSILDEENLEPIYERFGINPLDVKNVESLVNQNGEVILLKVVVH